MRFRRCTRRVAALLMSSALAALAGCDGLTGRQLDPNRGWFDPSELVAARHGPLRVPILNQLSPGIEEPNEVYAGASEPKAEDLIPPQGDYPIGKNDLLAISITDLVGQGLESNKTARVTETGKISLPLIGQIQAEGLTEAQLEQAIRDAYRDAQIIQNAQVTVVLAEAQSRAFSILGSVGSAGKYPILRNDFRVLDALVLARGVATQGVDYIYILRQSDQPATANPNVPSGPTGPQTAPGNPANSVTPRGTGSTGQPRQPGQSPADLITPRNQPQNPSQPQQPPRMMIVQDQPATTSASTGPSAGTPSDVVTPATSAPATAVGTAPRNEGEPRYIIGPDGRPMLVGADEASRQTPEQPTRLNPPSIPSTQGFAFNEIREPGEQRVIRLPYTDLKNGQLKYNIVIKPNDLIYVPDPLTGEYYMGGHVARVGVYSLTARKITIKEAVISAGMLDQLGIPGRTQIIRRLPGDREVFARVDLEKIFAGLEPDIYLKPDDQILVGTNGIAPFLAAFRGAFRITYGFGFLYDRNYAPQQQIR